jgi:hypothetical protein
MAVASPAHRSDSGTRSAAERRETAERAREIVRMIDTWRERERAAAEPSLDRVIEVLRETAP